jgi:hypothetical protein
MRLCAVGSEWVSSQLHRPNNCKKSNTIISCGDFPGTIFGFSTFHLRGVLWVVSGAAGQHRLHLALPPSLLSFFISSSCWLRWLHLRHAVSLTPCMRDTRTHIFHSKCIIIPLCGRPSAPTAPSVPPSHVPRSALADSTGCELRVSSLRKRAVL